MRFDLSVVASWIEPDSRVLDLGCGEGDLLHYLAATRRARGYGIEKVEEKAAQAISRGLSVLHGDINAEVADYPDKYFDYVILSQTLQQVYDPAALIRQMLRVGRRGIVSFPNFAHYRNRLMLALTGRAPVSRELPYEWYDTPNIRVITIADFKRFCRAHGFAVTRDAALRTYYRETEGKFVRVLPNLRATYGVFLLEGRE